MSIATEFKAFVLRGNVVDLAVGVIIGAAFGRIVTSLVNDVIMPPIGYAIAGIDFNDLAITLGGEVRDPADPSKTIPASIKYGRFIQTLLDFVIVAAVLFSVVKVTNRLRRKEANAPTELSTGDKLLTEIRDELRSRG